MRYRAILITDKKLERPIQTFSNYLDMLRKWAFAILKENTGYVEIYEMKEEKIETISPENKL